jgi:hypothetical protein
LQLDKVDMTDRDTRARCLRGHAGQGKTQLSD